MRVLFKSVNLIGDSLYIGPALRKWLQKTAVREDEIYMWTLNDHIAPLYPGMIRDMEYKLKVVFDRPEGNFDFEHVFNVNDAFALSDKKKQHVAESYAELLGVELDRYIPNAPGIASKATLKPIFIPEQETLSPEMARLGTERPILISMFSASCESRDKDHPGLPPNKMIPWEKWIPMIELLRKEYPDVPIRFLGAPTDMVPDEYVVDTAKYAFAIVRPGEYMLGIPLNQLAIIMQYARLVVTIDNGMSHLAASQEAPTCLFYPRCLGPWYILPIGNP